MSRDARKSLVIWQTVSNWTSYTRPLEGSTIKEPARARCTLWIGFWFATLARPTTQMAPEGNRTYTLQLLFGLAGKRNGSYA